MWCRQKQSVADGQTDGWQDGRTANKVIALWYFASMAPIKLLNHVILQTIIKVKIKSNNIFFLVNSVTGTKLDFNFVN